MTGAEEKSATGRRGDEGKKPDRSLEEIVGAERQKVMGRGVLMALCRAGLWGMQGLVGAEGWMERGIDGEMEEGEGSVVSSWTTLPLIRAAQVCCE